MSGPTTEREPPRIAYVSLRFPVITETFNLREMLYLRQLGWPLELYSLLRPRAGSAMHAEAVELAAATEYSPWLLGRSVFRALAHYLRKSPGRLLRVLLDCLSDTRRAPLTLLKTLAIFPKSLAFAHLAETRGVTHIHATFASHNATCALIMSRLGGIPFSFTIDAYDLFVETALLPRKLAAACFVTTISAFNLRVLRGRYGDAAIRHLHVIRRGIDLQRFRPAGTADSAAPDGPLRLICVAALRAKKGHGHLIDALALLRGQGLEVHCSLVGDGPLRREIRRRIRDAGLGDRISLAGDLTQDAVLARLQGSDACVLPSVVLPDGRMEGIPNALMEAMACELPVIGSDISGIPELIEHGRNGLLVPPGDARALAAAIARIHREREWARKLGQAGRRRVAERFNRHTNLARLASLHEQAHRLRMAGEVCRIPGEGGPEPDQAGSVPGQVAQQLGDGQGQPEVLQVEGAEKEEKDQHGKE